MPSDSSDSDSVDWDSLKTVNTFDGLDETDKKRHVNFDSASRSTNGAATGTNGTNTAGSTQLVTGTAANTFIDHITHNASTPVSLLVESLVQQLCSMLDTDPQRSSQLYMRICEQLHQMRLIDGTYAMGEFELMRSQYQRALYQLVSVARGQELPLPVQSVWPLTQPVGMDWSRYHREFDELAFVAGGGFGKVYRARHKLDGIVYAVKKVTIKSITIGRILSHLAEVKTLAGLNHQNVVSYKAAWLEPLLEDPTTAVKAANDARRLTGDASAIDGEDDDDDEEGDEESEFTASMTCGSNFCGADESSDFIQFEMSQQSSQIHSTTTTTRTSNNRTHVSQQQRQVTVFNETQAHLNLKWATLYIQMTLCQMTLREWMDERNQADDFAAFYAKFRLNFQDGVRQDAATNTTPYDQAEPVGFGQVAHELFQQLVSGLEYIHSRGIIHHDIKPSNIFVGMEANGRLSVQLGDFGLACPLQEEHRSNNLVGTPTYAAPEQLKGCCDPKSDVFSLGVVLVELLMPFGTDMERIKTIEAVRRQEVPEKFPELYANLLVKLVAADTTARPSTQQILTQLHTIRQDDSVQEAQRQVDTLAAELTRLRTEIDAQSGATAAQSSPSLRAQLTSKDDELRTKNNEIWRLQRQIIMLRRNAVEVRSKDAEIRRLRAALRRKSSRSDETGEDDAEEGEEDF